MTILVQKNLARSTILERLNVLGLGQQNNLYVWNVGDVDKHSFNRICTWIEQVLSPESFPRGLFGPLLRVLLLGCAAVIRVRARRAVGGAAEEA